MFSLTHILILLENYKYILLLPIAIVEGPIVTVLAGFLVSIHILNFYFVYCIVIVGDIVGDVLYYCIGRFGEKTIIPRFGPYIGITPERIQKVETLYMNHLGKTILFGKVTQAPIVAILIAAGITKTDFRKYLQIVFFVAIPKTLFFLLLGYYLGKSYQVLNIYIGYSVFIGGIILSCVILGYYLFKRFKKDIV